MDLTLEVRKPSGALLLSQFAWRTLTSDLIFLNFRDLIDELKKLDEFISKIPYDFNIIQLKT